VPVEMGKIVVTFITNGCAGVRIPPEQDALDADMRILDDVCGNSATPTNCTSLTGSNGDLRGRIYITVLSSANTGTLSTPSAAGSRESELVRSGILDRLLKQAGP